MCLLPGAPRTQLSEHAHGGACMCMEKPCWRSPFGRCQPAMLRQQCLFEAIAMLCVRSGPGGASKHLADDSGLVPARHFAQWPEGVRRRARTVRGGGAGLALVRLLFFDSRSSVSERPSLPASIPLRARDFNFSAASFRIIRTATTSSSDKLMAFPFSRDMRRFVLRMCFTTAFFSARNRSCSRFRPSMCWRKGSSGKVSTMASFVAVMTETALDSLWLLLAMAWVLGSVG